MTSFASAKLVWPLVISGEDIAKIQWKCSARERQLGAENRNEERQKLHPFDPLTWFTAWATLIYVSHDKINLAPRACHLNTQRLRVYQSVEERDLFSLSMLASHIEAAPSQTEQSDGVTHTFDFSQVDVTQVTFAIRFFVLFCASSLAIPYNKDRNRVLNVFSTMEICSDGKRIWQVNISLKSIGNTL